MNLRGGIYAVILSSAALIPFSGCGTVSYLDDKVGTYVDKHEDWTKDIVRDSGYFSVFRTKKDKNPEQKS